MKVSLKPMANALKQPIEKRADALKPLLDLPDFLRFMAMEVLICHWDGYCLARNNYRIWLNSKTGKATFIPSGTDQIFSKMDYPVRPTMNGLAARSVLELPDGPERYRKSLQELLQAMPEPARLHRELTEWRSLLQQGASPSEQRRIVDEGIELETNVIQRFDFVRKALREAEPAAPLAGARVELTSWSGSEGAADSTNLCLDATVNAISACKTALILPSGTYSFRARVKTMDVAALPFGKNQGARIRLEGTSSASPGLLGSQDWQILQFEFKVEDLKRIQLICELRGSSGKCCFDRKSLELWRIR